MVRKHEMDNRCVVPYNPYLLKYFNCHINVEACGSIKAIKYLFKYIYKGHDKACITVGTTTVDDNNGGVDEIKQYRNVRWVTPLEALWRIYDFDLSENDPPIMQLQHHLPGMNMVGYQQNQNIENVLKRQGSEQSMLTEYFEKNKTDEDARTILY
jgi:ATP-dependent DNA helicase PIF1